VIFKPDRWTALSALAPAGPRRRRAIRRWRSCSPPAGRPWPRPGERSRIASTAARAARLRRTRCRRGRTGTSRGSAWRLHPKNSPGRTGAESHCTTKLVQAPHYLAYTVRADGARRPRGRKVAPSFEHCSAHEDADADEQEQHEDEEQGHVLSVDPRGRKSPRGLPQGQFVERRRGEAEAPAAPLS
jgi:hypothetical protein